MAGASLTLVKLDDEIEQLPRLSSQVAVQSLRLASRDLGVQG
jgi:dihydroxyacetone kinase